MPKLTPQTTLISLSITKIEVNSEVKRAQNYWGVFGITAFSQAKHIPGQDWVWTGFEGTEHEKEETMQKNCQGWVGCPVVWSASFCNWNKVLSWGQNPNPIENSWTCIWRPNSSELGLYNLSRPASFFSKLLRPYSSKMAPPHYPTSLAYFRTRAGIYLWLGVWLSLVAME